MIQENKISPRQFRRMIFIETFGAGALSVPTFACYKGQSGLWSAFFYGIFLVGTTAFFVIFSEKIQKGALERLIKKCPNIREETLKNTGIKGNITYADICSTSTKRNITYADTCSTPIKMIYIIRFFINAVALFYFFGKTIQSVYMPDSSMFFIFLPAAILLWYSLHTTLQKRARFLELIFPWIIIMYLIAVILSFLGIERAVQVGNMGEIWPEIFSDNIFQSIENGYLILLCNSPIEFILFLKPAAKTKAIYQENKVQKNMMQVSRRVTKKDEVYGVQGAKKGENRREEKKNKKDEVLSGIIIPVTGAFFCHIIFIFLAVRTLGKELTSQSAWPVIKMMQLIRMPGGFLERFDILPIVFWILCMIAVLSGYLYYGRNIFESVRNDKERFDIQKEQHRVGRFTGIAIVCLLLLACLVEKFSFLWTFYLKYKIFVDFPLSLILPVIVLGYGRKKNGEKEKIEKKQEVMERNKRDNRNNKDNKSNKNNENNRMQEENNKGINLKKVTGMILVALIISPILFFTAGCQRLTDVEEKNYILSMYVDYPSDEEKVYDFWVARANLSEMDERSDEIPCEITRIKAENLQELEEKYLETVPGKTEWNHIYTIFLGPGIAMDKGICTQLLKEWDKEWKKSPNVLLALCQASPKKLYQIKNIPDGAAGQEASLLAEQNKEKFSGEICETPIDYLRFVKKQGEKVPLYRIILEQGKMKIAKGVL